MLLLAAIVTLVGHAIKSRGTASSILPGGLVQGLYWDCFDIVDWSKIAGMIFEDGWGYGMIRYWNWRDQVYW